MWTAGLSCSPWPGGALDALVWPSRAPSHPHPANPVSTSRASRGTTPWPKLERFHLSFPV
jgi:hypothetical protein